MLESAIERKFVTGILKAGAFTWKFVSPGRRGVPDRIVFLPWGRVIFVELKTPVGRLSASQKLIHRKLRKACFEVRVIYGKQEVEDFVDEIHAMVVSKFCDGLDPFPQESRLVFRDGSGEDSGYTDRCKETP